MNKKMSYPSCQKISIMRSNAIKTKSIRTQYKVSHFGKINKRKKENENVCLHFYNKRKNELRNFIATIITRPHIHANPPYSRKSPIFTQIPLLTTALKVLFRTS